MKRVFGKLKDRRGESFIEILIAILIVAFGCLLIATMYTSAMNLNIDASQKDSDFYKAVSEMEQMFSDKSGTSGEAVFQDKNGNEFKEGILMYGGDGANAAYRRAKGA